MPNLIDALQDEKEDVRVHAAFALGGIGPTAKAAVPSLIEVLKDDEALVRLDAARALGRIATALQDRQDTTAIPDIEMALAALQAGNFKENAAHVHQALNALKAIEKAR